MAGNGLVLWLIAEFTAALWESRLEKAGEVPPIARVVSRLKKCSGTPEKEAAVLEQVRTNT